MDLVVDGPALLIEPVSPAAADLGGDGFASASLEGALDVADQAAPVLLDAVLETGRGIAVDAVDKHVDAAGELGNAVGCWLFSPGIPDLVGNPLGLVGELAVRLVEHAGVGGGGKQTGEFHFFAFLVFLSKH